MTYTAFLVYELFVPSKNLFQGPKALQFRDIFMKLHNIFTSIILLYLSVYAVSWLYRMWDKNCGLICKLTTCQKPVFYVRGKAIDFEQSVTEWWNYK